MSAAGTPNFTAKIGPLTVYASQFVNIKWATYGILSGFLMADANSIAGNKDATVPYRPATCTL